MSQKGYQVFARKYRPQTFADLMGQDILVTTLKNAIENQRIPHAILLTGVRGIGKTTTARLIARALNCIGVDGKGHETITPCGVCTHCKAILEDCHLDVIEMDAASRTSVDDIRAIIATASYKPASARYKIQIIDEVHMLTKQAFNALLKTLEEPPNYTKFIFATTELHRIPDTIISRCVRFDLQRFDRETVSRLLEKICTLEKISFEPQAIALLAQAANGSARDGQSLLERAVGLCPKKITEQDVRSMLGLTGIEDCCVILEGIIAGDASSTLKYFNHLYQNGMDPDHFLSDILDLVHQITTFKVSPEIDPLISMTQELTTRLQGYAVQLSIPVLMRLWQVLVKGREELRSAPSSVQAVQMILIRVCYLNDMPHAREILAELAAQKPSLSLPEPGAQDHTKGPENAPNEDKAQKKTLEYACEEPNTGEALNRNGMVIKSIMTEPHQNSGTNENQPPLVPSPHASDHHSSEQSTQSQQVIQSLHDVTYLCSMHKEPLLKYALENYVHVISLDASQHRLVLGIKTEAPKTFAADLRHKLQEWTQTLWRVETQPFDETQQTIREQEQEKQKALLVEAQSSPLVKTALEMFTGAEIKEVKRA